jgi:hypothetical protein
VTAFSLQEILLIKKIIYSLDAVKCRLICWGVRKSRIHQPQEKQDFLLLLDVSRLFETIRDKGYEVPYPNVT